MTADNEPISYMTDYIAKMRQKIGQDLFIHPAARILIENELGEVLLVHKRDRDSLAIPAGALEEGETIEACIRREVKEETGLIVGKLQVIGIITNPENETVRYPNGDLIQYFTIEFFCQDFSGEIKVHDQEEIVSAAFYPPNYLDLILANEKSVVRSLAHFREKGVLRLD